MNKINGAKYINERRRDFSLYVLQNRAIPSACDGLKPAARRVLWTARNGEKIKSASLAGATMPIHPHASPEGVIDTLTGQYNNNIPLFTGFGAFGTLLFPDAYGASRYTSVKISEFTKDVIFKDIEIIPMVENYDSELLEPKHFIPLVPIALINPNEGIAVGFSTRILPRDLTSIVESQIEYLITNNVTIKDLPYFRPNNNTASSGEKIETGTRWTFIGDYEQLDTYTIKVNKLPYGLSYKSFLDKLIKLVDDGTILDYDDYSKDVMDIRIKFKRGYLSSTTKEQVISLLGLTSSQNELMNLIDFDFESVLNTDFHSYIKLFTDWRLIFYKNRYERLLKLLEEDIQKYKDILLCIDKKVANIAPKLKDKEELQELLKDLGVVNFEYISNLSIYRLTTGERAKVQVQLDDALIKQQEYIKILGSEKERRKIYLTELQQVLKKYG